MPFFKIRHVVLLLAIATADLAAAPLFEDSAVLDVKLIGPLGSVLADTEDRSERSFLLEAEGAEHRIKVRVRGRSRLRVCEFPLLRLNFRHEDTPQTVFAGQDKLKLVTHCRNVDRAEQDLLEEYTAYRIFNVLTDLSYRVRLMRINYEDVDGDLDGTDTHRFGFVLETAEQLAARVGAEPVTMEGVPKKRHDLDHAALVYVYQFLVANTDWGLVKADYDEGCCHNLDLFEREDTVIIIPYDLDLSGFVNAKYAFPDRLLRIRKVTHRLYRGLCTESTILSSAIDTVIASKSEILAVVQNTPGLTESNRATAIRFVGRFFELAADKEKLMRNFESRCIG